MRRLIASTAFAAVTLAASAALPCGGGFGQGLEVDPAQTIVVTHDLAVARLLSTRMMVMQQGQVIETGLTDQVLEDPQAPYTQLLVSSVLQV